MEVHPSIDTDELAEQTVLRMLAGGYRNQITALPRQVVAELGRLLMDGSRKRVELLQWLKAGGHRTSVPAFYRFADRFQRTAWAIQRELLPQLIPPRLLTPDEVAASLRVDRQTVDQLIAGGNLRVVVIGDATRIEREAVAEFKAAHRQPRDKAGRFKK